MAAPISLSIAIPQIQQFVNTALLGHYATLDQSVLGIGGIIYLFLLSFGFGISNAAMIFFSRYSGMDDRRGLGRSFNTLFISTTLISLLVVAFYYLIIEDIISTYLLSDVISEKVTEYMDVVVYSLPFFILSQLVSSFLISIGKSILILKITLIGTVVHILFDYVLIFGLWGFDAYGILGSAYAAIIADVTMLFIGMILLYRQGFVKYYGLQLYGKYDVSKAVNQLKVCMPLILQYLITLGSWLTFFVVIENMGEVELAASQSVRAAMGLCSVTVWAFASVSNSFTSNLLGQEKPKLAKQTIYKIAFISLFSTLIFSIIFWFFPMQLMDLLSSDEEVISAGIGPLRVIGFSILLMAFSTSLFNGIIGTGRVGVSILVEIIAVIIYLLVLFYVLIPGPYGLTGMWYSEFVYWSVIFVLSVLYLNSKYFGKPLRTHDY